MLPMWVRMAAASASRSGRVTPAKHTAPRANDAIDKRMSFMCGFPPRSCLAGDAQTTTRSHADRGRCSRANRTAIGNRLNDLDAVVSMKLVKGVCVVNHEVEIA